MVCQSFILVVQLWSSWENGHIWVILSLSWLTTKLTSWVKAALCVSTLTMSCVFLRSRYPMTELLLMKASCTVVVFYGAVLRANASILPVWVVWSDVKGWGGREICHITHIVICSHCCATCSLCSHLWTSLAVAIGVQHLLRTLLTDSDVVGYVARHSVDFRTMSSPIGRYAYMYFCCSRYGVLTLHLLGRTTYVGRP